MADTTNLITVFADASFREGYAGYAVWCRNSTQVEKMSDYVSFKVYSSAEAETLALSQAIMFAMDKLEHEPKVIVVAQSDCLHALGVLRAAGGKPAKTSDRPVPIVNGRDVEIAFAKKALQLIAQKEGMLWLKHVKGHSGTLTGRSSLNNWCDLEAKVARRKAEKTVTL